MTPYTPHIEKRVANLYKNINSRFPYIQLAIWETKWLNEFTQHLASKSLTILETEKDALESVFFHVQEKSKSAFLNPSKEIMERYVMSQDKSTIIKPIVTEAPVLELKDVVVPSLEKILVDLYCDTEIFYFYQGRELSHVWENAFSKYTIQRDKLLRYADRRRKKQDVLKFLTQIQNATYK